MKKPRIVSIDVKTNDRYTNDTLFAVLQEKIGTRFGKWEFRNGTETNDVIHELSTKGAQRC